MIGRSAHTFHTNRRAFIMMPNGDLLIAPESSELSHEQMLKNTGMNANELLKFLADVPRGYFMNRELCIYQGFDMTVGAIWKIKSENYDIVRAFIPRLCKEFSVDDNTNLYLGVRVGEIGAIWEKLYKTTIGAFMR